MKHFEFSLESVLHYQQDLLDTQKLSYAKAVEVTQLQEAVLQALELQYQKTNEEFCSRKKEGLSMADACSFDLALRSLEARMRAEHATLLRCQEAEEAEREQLVEKKVEAGSLELLRERRLEDYNSAVLKSEEKQMDEFMLSARFRANLQS